MKTTKYYHKNSDVVAFQRFYNQDGYWYEFTYDEIGDNLTYKDSYGFFEIKGKEVTEEEFNNFLKSVL